MPVVTRSHSRRSKKKQEESSSGEGSPQPQEKKTPRRSARIAAQRSESRELSEGGTPVSNPGQQPHFSGITLGSDTLNSPMRFLVPRHEAESPFNIRHYIRQFTESPVTLKETQNKKQENQNDNKDNNDNDNDNDNSQNINSSLLSPNRNMQLTSQPSRVPTFDQTRQAWSFEPEQEMPQVAKSLTIFIISLIVIVLAVVYKDELCSVYDAYMPGSFSDVYTKLSDVVFAIYGYFYDLVTSIFPSNDDVSTPADASGGSVDDVTPDKILDDAA